MPRAATPIPNNREPTPHAKPRLSDSSRVEGGTIPYASHSREIVRSAHKVGNTSRPKKPKRSQMFSHFYVFTNFMGSVKLPFITPLPVISRAPYKDVSIMILLMPCLRLTSALRDH